MKGLAILGVIMIHSGISRELLPAGGYFWLAQAVPVFMVLLGLNLSISLRGRSPSLAAVYTQSYWKSRWRRVFIPFIITFCLSALVAVVSGILQPGYRANLGVFTFVGVLPTGGPGNYFLTVLFQFVLIGPALWVAFRKSPRATLLCALAVDIAFELWAGQSALVAGHPYIGEAWIVRFVFAIAIGMWLADDWTLSGRRNRFVIVGGGAAAAHTLLALLVGWSPPLGLYDAPTMYFAAYLYASVLVMLGMAVLPSAAHGAGTRSLAKTGRESYHIFLVQILWFTSLGLPVERFVTSAASDRLGALGVEILLYAINAAVCLSVGAIFFKMLAPRPAPTVAGTP